MTSQIRLVPVSSRHYEFLRERELAEPLLWHWRHRGVIKSPEDYPATLWNGVLSLKLVVEASTAEPLGMLSIYQADHRNQHAYFAAVRFSSPEKSVPFIRGLRQFISEAFEQFPFRKLYAEVIEPNLEQIHGLVRAGIAHEEGRLHEHVYVDGRFQDQILLAISRASWDGWLARLRSVVEKAGSEAFTEATE